MGQRYDKVRDGVGFAACRLLLAAWRRTGIRSLRRIGQSLLDREVRRVIRSVERGSP